MANGPERHFLAVTTNETVWRQLPDWALAYVVLGQTWKALPKFLQNRDTTVLWAIVNKLVTRPFDSGSEFLWYRGDLQPAAAPAWVGRQIRAALTDEARLFFDEENQELRQPEDAARALRLFSVAALSAIPHIPGITIVGFSRGIVQHRIASTLATYGQGGCSWRELTEGVLGSYYRGRGTTTNLAATVFDASGGGAVTQAALFGLSPEALTLPMRPLDRQVLATPGIEGRLRALSTNQWVALTSLMATQENTQVSELLPVVESC